MRLSPSRDVRLSPSPASLDGPPCVGSSAQHGPSQASLVLEGLLLQKVIAMEPLTEALHAPPRPMHPSPCTSPPHAPLPMHRTRYHVPILSTPPQHALGQAERATCTELLATVMLQIQSGGHFALDMQQARPPACSRLLPCRTRPAQG